MKQQYKTVNLREDARKLLVTLDSIIEEYTRQGLRLSLRQLYYQLVARSIVPNTEQSYKRVGDIVSNGRLAGLLSWEAIEDRGRQARRPSEFKDVKSLVDAALYSYRLPRLKGQGTYVEVHIEKAALEGVLSPLSREFHVVLLANKGYGSSSTMWETACRIDARCRDEEGNVVSDALVLYLGDLDPSGEDMVRDVRERLDMFLAGYVEDGSYEGEEGTYEEKRISPTGWTIDEFNKVDLSVRKVALTMEQVKQYNPPPNPAKLSDSRAAEFVKKYGTSSWEVDALPPDVLQRLIRDELLATLDMTLVEAIKMREERDKQRLRVAAEEIMRGGQEEKEDD